MTEFMHAVCEFLHGYALNHQIPVNPQLSGMGDIRNGSNFPG